MAARTPESEAAKAAVLERAKEPLKVLAHDLRDWGVTNPNAVARDLVFGLAHAGFEITKTGERP